MRKQHVFIVSFEFIKGRLTGIGSEPVKSKEKAIERAEQIVEHYAGVGVYGIWVDDVTCDTSDLEQIAVFGETPELDEIAAAA